MAMTGFELGQHEKCRPSATEMAHSTAMTPHQLPGPWGRRPSNTQEKTGHALQQQSSIDTRPYRWLFNQAYTPRTGSRGSAAGWDAAAHEDVIGHEQGQGACG